MLDTPSSDRPKEDDTEDHWAHIPKNATLAGMGFFRQHIDDLKFISGESLATDEFEELTKSVARAILPDRDPKDAFPSLFANVERMRSQNTRNWGIRREVMLCRYVDSYLTYISDLLVLIFKSRPETLRSAEQVTYEEVLQHRTIDDFIEWAAEQRVNALSFKGLPSIEEYLKKKIGLDLFIDEQLRRTAVSSIAIRNLLVHRRGVADARFLKIVQDLGVKVGQRIVLDHDTSWRAAYSALECVRDIDVRATEKFGLSTHKTDEENWWGDG